MHISEQYRMGTKERLIKLHGIHMPPATISQVVDMALDLLGDPHNRIPDGRVVMSLNRFISANEISIFSEIAADCGVDCKIGESRRDNCNTLVLLRKGKNT